MGLRWWRPHQALSRAFEPQADAGWPPPLVSPVSFRRATQTYKERTFGPFASTTIRSYYRDYVIGGAGAFVIAVENVADFEPAIRTKLTTEIAELHPLTQRVAYVSKHPLAVDCEARGSRRGR